MLQPKDRDWLNGYKNKNPYICCLQDIHLKPKDTYRLKVKGWKNIFHDNGSEAKENWSNNTQIRQKKRP